MEDIHVSLSEEKSVSRAAGVVGFFTFLSRVLGLIRDMVVATFFGSGMAADAFFVAFRVPNLLRSLFAEGSLTAAFIPVFTEVLTTKSKEEAFEVARIVLTLLSLLLAVVTLLGILLSPWIVRLQAFGFGGSGLKYDLTVLLARITFPYIFLISLVAFFMGILNSLRRFAAPAAAPIFLNVGIIGGVFLISPHLSEPVVGLSIGVLIGGILQVALQIPPVVRSGFKVMPRWQPRHPAVKRIGLLIIPTIFGSAVYQLNQFLGTLLASFLPEGSVSWLYYADRLVQFPLGVFAIAISTAALPSLSAHAANKDFDRFDATLNHALRLVFFITLPSMVGLIVLGESIVHVLFERGAFNATSTAMTNRALLFYTLGLWAFSGIRVVVSGFYALQDTRTPVKVAVVAVAANGVFSLALMGPLKHGGLALALSLASSLQFLLLLFLMRKKIPMRNLGMVLLSSSKCALAAALMGLGISYLQSRWLRVDSGSGTSGIVMNLAGLVAIGMFIYFASTAALGCREIKSLWAPLQGLLRKRKGASR